MRSVVKRRAPVYVTFVLDKVVLEYFWFPFLTVHPPPFGTRLLQHEKNYQKDSRIDPVISGGIGQTNCLTFLSAFNPLTPELNPSAQRCLTRFFTGDFPS
jgi:hypothetical protein